MFIVVYVFQLGDETRPLNIYRIYNARWNSNVLRCRKIPNGANSLWRDIYSWLQVDAIAPNLLQTIKYVAAFIYIETLSKPLVSTKHNMVN